MLIKPTEKPECKYLDMSVVSILWRHPNKKNQVREAALLGGREMN